MTIAYIAHADLDTVVAQLAEKQRVLVPTLKPAVKKSTVFAPYVAGTPVQFMKATIAPKEVVLPACETLMSFKKDKNEDGTTSLTIDDAPKAEPTILFGCRPCDARGFAVLDKPYLEGPFLDPYYKARRDLLTVVTYACPSTGPTCFCHWFDNGPDSTKGADAILTPIDGGYVLEPVNEKGETFVAGLMGGNVVDGASKTAEAADVRAKSVATLGDKPDLSQAQEKIAALFNDAEFWQNETALCLSCGACTYMCPTCYCFNITDEGDGVEREGKRIRTWDTCMSSLFTREASGHNSRMGTAQRMKNRVSHKFSNYPENWGTFSCSGCGRCVSNCPVSLDIRHIVLAALSK
ncbi:MAG: 4Fe-4S dicluster domain-containing protein [Pseudomonadota bacterium]